MKLDPAYTIRLDSDSTQAIMATTGRNPKKILDRIQHGYWDNKADIVIEYLKTGMYNYSSDFFLLSIIRLLQISI